MANLADTKLSIIIPAYNEEATIDTLLTTLSNTSFPCPVEVIVVDDGSRDRTREILTSYEDTHVIVFHEQNQGKGAAIRTGLAKVSGTHVVIQDADLEYDPADLVRMITYMKEHDLSVLYGSRSMEFGKNEAAGFLAYWGGQVVTLATNILYNQRLTDEPTCYKMFRTDFITDIKLNCMRFEFCPEITAKVAKKGVRINEIPISYHPRTAAEGKKINWRDGIEALWTLVKYRL